MADTVTNVVSHDGARNYVLHLTNRSDGTGESAVTKVDVSTLTGPDGFSTLTQLAVESIEYDVQGFSRVDLLWDANTNQPIALLGTGNGYFDRAGIDQVDPQATGFTGDVLLTTNGAVNGASYDILVHFKKHA